MFSHASSVHGEGLAMRLWVTNLRYYSSKYSVSEYFKNILTFAQSDSVNRGCTVVMYMPVPPKSLHGFMYSHQNLGSVSLSPYGDFSLPHPGESSDGDKNFQHNKVHTSY